MSSHRPAQTSYSTNDSEIQDNINGRMHGPMNGFIKKFFGKFQYVHQDASLEIRAVGGMCARYPIPSTAPSPDGFLQWFSSLVLRDLDRARGLWNLSSYTISPKHLNGDNGTRLLMTMPSLPASDRQTECGWENAEVIGQFYHHSCICYQDGLLHLCRSSRRVFASQPTRLFLHGFYIRGSLVEFWVFDRSGLYCSDLFDIRRETGFIQFLSIILSYQLLTDQDLGRNSVLETHKSRGYLILDSVAMPSLSRLYLESRPIACRAGLVGSGATCYRARLPDSNRWDYVLKFKWVGLGPPRGRASKVS